MSFLLYHLAKYQKCQKLLYEELKNIFPEFTVSDINSIKDKTPYLQSCIKESLRYLLIYLVSKFYCNSV